MCYYPYMGKTISFIPAEGLREKLEKIAKDQDRSLSYIINKMLLKAIEAEEKNPKK